MSDMISRLKAIETALSFFVEYCGGAFDEDMQIGLKQRLEEVPTESRWIPCSERLPEAEKQVLVCLPDGTIDLAVYTISKHLGKYTFAIDEEVFGLDVIAWMPLPEPYRKEKSDEAD